MRRLVVRYVESCQGCSQMSRKIFPLQTTTAPRGQMMLPDASGVSWTIFTLHACLQPGIFSGAQAGDRDPAIVPASSFLSHHFEVFFLQR
jgi:hypothetical protein